MPGFQPIRSAVKAASRSVGKKLFRCYRDRLRTKEAEELFGLYDSVRDPAFKAYRHEIDGYWKTHLGRSIHPLWHIACAKATGLRDVRYISSNEWWEDILPFHNDLSFRASFRDKNLSDIFLNYPYAPQAIIKRMHGRYYTSKNEPISRIGAEEHLTADEKDLILKPSQLDDGHGIRTLQVKRSQLFLNGEPCQFGDIESRYGPNFLIQEKITQHPSMAQVHPDSVNTIRVATFRWKDEIRVLMTIARFGTFGKLTDNARTGGLWCGIDEKGCLNDSAVDKSGKAYSRHPSTGFPFAKRVTVPNFDKVCKLALNLHKHIYHFDIVSWDIAIDYDGKPLFLEVNFQGMIHIYQFAARQPLFGELTQEVLENIRDKRELKRALPG